jgi:adenine specific DNA methylase Mod
MTKSNNEEKRFFFNVIEEMIMNPQYAGYRGGRIEVYDSEDESGYAVYEGRFFLPEEFYHEFREIFDFKYTDKFVRIDFNTAKLVEGE